MTAVTSRQYRLPVEADRTGRPAITDKAYRPHGPSIYVLCTQAVSLLADIAGWCGTPGQSQGGHICRAVGLRRQRCSQPHEAPAGGLILSAALVYDAGLFMLRLREFFTFADK